ncbi:MAG: hypothetical protein KAR45_01170, partial [Desulfobacteraceae bacterium]|nr:hypothetical protein [Desulfobacteraceae bacterium]
MAIDLFQSKKHIFNYNDPDNDLFQVILPEFILNKKQFGLEVDIEINENLFSIRNINGKKDFNAAIKKSKIKNQKSVAKNINDFKNDDNCLSYKFIDPEYYFRYANGGVLPILRLKIDESNARED